MKSDIIGDGRQAAFDPDRLLKTPGTLLDAGESCLGAFPASSPARQMLLLLIDSTEYHSWLRSILEEYLYCSEIIIRRAAYITSWTARSAPILFIFCLGCFCLLATLHSHPSIVQSLPHFKQASRYRVISGKMHSFILLALVPLALASNFSKKPFLLPRQGGDSFKPGSSTVFDCPTPCGTDWCLDLSNGDTCCTEGCKLIQ